MEYFNKSPQKGSVFTVMLEDGSTKAMEEMSVQTDHELWGAHQNEGKLAVDVAQTNKDIVIVATISGALPERIEVCIHNDLLTIRGQRESSLDEYKDVHYYYQECFWGKFSRTVVLPVEVKADLARAEYRNGILTITVPKRQSDAKVPVIVVED